MSQCSDRFERANSRCQRQAQSEQRKLLGAYLTEFFQPVCDEALPDLFVALLTQIDATGRGKGSS